MLHELLLFECLVGRLDEVSVLSVDLSQYFVFVEGCIGFELLKWLFVVLLGLVELLEEEANLALAHHVLRIVASKR